MAFGFFDPQKRQLRSLQKYVDSANSLEKEVKNFSGDQIRAKVDELKKTAHDILSPARNIEITREKDKPWTAVSEGGRFVENIDELIPYSAALVREVTLRASPKHRLRDVQIMSGVSMTKGNLSEFFTGEGKTFAAILPLMLYGLFERGAHLVTVNEYLAKRDAEWVGRMLSSLGLTTSVVTHEGAFKFVPVEELGEFKEKSVVKEAEKTNWDLLNTMAGNHLIEVSKKEAYACDVTYGTNSEFGFDYLRDNMARQIEDVNQPELFFGIVDEADSIMVDESRTPLIISAPAKESNEMYKKFAQIAARLEVNDVEIDEKDKSVTLKEESVDKVQKWAGVDNVWEDYAASHHLENALKARYLYKRDDQYIVQDGQINIVDEFTGRVLPGRRWSEGLHQAVEAKEGVEIMKRSRTLATITYQNFFRLYYVLAGMTATALTEAEEFAKIYNLDVVVVPTHHPVIRKDYTDVIYKTVEAKYRAVVREIKDRHEKGQPILVGTTSVENSEKLSDLLKKEGVKHEVLNAKYHEKEAKIVAKAGELGSVTISTNMAGRGTDIRLGEDLQEKLVEGNIEFALKRLRNAKYSEVKLVPPTEIEFRKLKVATEKLKGKDFDVSIDDGAKTVTLSTKNESGEVLETPVNLGLHVLGTERHESRRIDNQLRGRSGRQGDPGSSQFFVSLQDDLMRIFGGATIESFFDRMGVDEDMPIEAKMLARQIETAQKRVEGYNFDIRKRLVEYDDVMNEQREVFYGRRRRLLKGFKEDLGKVDKKGVPEGTEDPDIPDDVFKLRDLSLEKLEALINSVVLRNASDGKIKKWKAFQKDVREVIPDEMAEEVVEKHFDTDYETWIKQLKSKPSAEHVGEQLKQLISEAYDFKEGAVGSEVMRKIERWVFLSVMDQNWTDHLDFMADLRSAIGLRGYGQRDPLTEYKNEAFDLFARMLSGIEENIAKRILRVSVVKRAVSEERQRQIEAARQKLAEESAQAQQEGASGVYKNIAKQIMEKKGQQSTLSPPQEKKKENASRPVRAGKKVGRNDPCPCGSGKKYKKCCYPKYE